MKEITADQVAEMRRGLVCDPQDGTLRNTAGRIVGNVDSRGYRHVTFRGGRYLAHQVAWALHYGVWPSHNVWFVNGNHDDLRKDNLRKGADLHQGILTQERLKELLVYNPDTGLFHWRINYGRMFSGHVAGYIGTRGYWQIMVHHRLCLAHRLAWLYVYGDYPPRGLEIDHINREKTDNRLSNLRLATPSDNVCNTVRQNPTGYAGAILEKATGRYRVRVAKNRNRRSYGTYDTAEEAHRVYVMAIQEMHGEFASIRRNENGVSE